MCELCRPNWHPSSEGIFASIQPEQQLESERSALLRRLEEVQAALEAAKLELVHATA